MSRIFIDIEVADAVRDDTQLARRLAEVCPVDIFAVGSGGALEIVEANLDECVLCRLCIEASPPGTVRVVKKYSGEALQ